MTGEVWVSSVMTDSSIGNKQGAREKYYNEDWAPADFIMGPSSPQILQAHRLHKRGIKLSCKQMTEAMFVFSPSHWSRVGDLFGAGAFYGVKGKLAEILMNYDLGEGELIEFPIYEADKKLNYPAHFICLILAVRKTRFCQRRAVELNQCTWMSKKNVSKISTQMAIIVCIFGEITGLKMMI